MAKYFELAEKLSEKFTPEIMCAIIARADSEKISDLMKEYGIE